MTGSADSRTRTVRAALDSDSQFNAVVPPIHLTTTFSFREFGAKPVYDYSRSGNPTRDSLAAALTDLEGGAGAVVTSSGMAAVTLVAHLCRSGELVLAPQDSYGGTFRLFSALARHGMLNVAFIDPTDLEALAEALAQKPRLVWLETPSNPLLRITDLARASALARAGGALVAVDNTFLSPVWQQPLALGADLVVHSTTKYLNGHSDVVGGAVVAGTQTLHEELTWWANCLGLTGAPFDSFLTLRGLRTLHARLALHAANAEAVVAMLVAHPAVVRVHFPGLPDHPGHAIAAAQQRAFGAMVSFEVVNGVDGVRACVEGLGLFSLAESLGGVESLIAHPATMTHAAMEPQARARAGISESLLRLSVGIESAADLVADLRAGLDRALAAR
ncbi:MAG TPA: cystathionine gamma-synthase [Steroidobacteraceae bacterium]|nr:cystathionine gamma-synthase [Steroidobacteraceae bacterium]